MGLRTLTPVGEPLPYNYSPVCGSPTWGVWNLIISQVCPSYPSHCGSLFMSLIVEGLFWLVPILFTDGCSAVSCDFGVIVRRVELRVLLLHHLGHSPIF